jgi:hypothetical protein
LPPNKPWALVFRSAATLPIDFDLSVNGRKAAHVRLEPGDDWHETRVDLPPPGAPSVEIVLGASDTERASYQIWAVSAP